VEINDFKKIIVISAPSGAGKTTIVQHLLTEFKDNISFSISACNRQKREGEIDGVDYYFLSTSEFLSKIEKDEFVEWEEVYQNNFYGTLKSEIERIWNLNKVAIVEVDVKGALSIKKIYPNKTKTIFIKVPSLGHLKKRLLARGTESSSSIEKRIRKAALELSFEKEFDNIVINDNLEDAKTQSSKIVTLILQNNT